jgi:cytochrome P450
MPLDPIVAVTAPDPYPYYRALAAQRPVYRDEQLGLWVVAGAAAVEAILMEPAARVRPVAEPVPKSIAGSPAGDVFGAFARMTDGPPQAAMKRAIQAALAGITAEQVAAMARAWLAKHLGGRDVVCAGTLNEIAVALPVSVVASLLGLPDAALPEARGLIAAFIAGIAPAAAPDQAVAASDAAERLTVLLRSLPVFPADVPEAAALANVLGLLFQTYDATAGLVGNTLLAASRHRDAYLRGANRARIPDFVDEVQRHDPAVHNTRRFLAADIDFMGHPLRQGDAILVVLAAANHDASANAAPERFDIDRADRRSFTFGAGRHGCPGTVIATAVAAAAAEILVPRLADLGGLADGIGYRPLPNLRIPVFGWANKPGGIA